MSNLNENTSYDNVKTQPSFVNLSAMLKNLSQKTETKSSDTVKSAISNHFNSTSSIPTILQPTMATSDTDALGNFEPGQIISPQVGTEKTEDLPEGYDQFVSADENKNWVNPSDQVKARNWPSDLGGGQYAIDPTQPGALVKSSRKIVTDQTRKKILGDLPGGLYEVDHVIPLWLGGTDSLKNLEILDKVEHKNKTTAQAVVMTLLANGKIDKNQAKIMAFSWKDKDIKGLPTPDNEGKFNGSIYLPLDISQKYAQKWEEDSTKPDMWKYFGESFKENMDKFGEGWLPDPIREFAKGLVGGGTAGIAPGTAPSADSNTFSKITNIAGNIVGTITGLGLLTKGVVKVLGGTKAIMGIKKGIDIADEAVKSTGAITDVGNISKTVAKSRVEKLSRMAKSAGLLSLWGQIGTTGKEITGQEEADFKNHVSQFMSDVAFGSILGAAGQTMKGYASVGLGTTALSLMEGDDILPAIQNGALMTALHGMGYKKGLIDPKTRIGNEEAYKMASTTMNQYVGNNFPTIKRGETVPSILTFEPTKIEKIKSDYKAKYPNDTRFDNVSDTGGAIQILGRDAKRNFLDIVKRDAGDMSQDQIIKEMTRITTAENQLYNQTLEPVARQEKEWADLVSIGEKLRPQTKTSQFTKAKDTNEILNKIPTLMEDIPVVKTSYPTGKSGITGYGGKLDSEAKANIDDFAKNPSNYDGKIYIPKNDEKTASFFRLLEQEEIANGSSIGNPDQVLRAFIRTRDGEFKSVGYIPREKSFDIKKDNLNKTYQIITNRLQEIRKSAKSPESMRMMYNADKSIIDIDPKTAEDLFARRAEKISDEELYSILKPNNAYEKLDSNLNNSSLSNKMDELGLNYIVVDPYKAWEINGDRPRWNPENPYLSIEITDKNWLQSLEMNKTKGLNNLDKAIKNMVEQIKTEGISEQPKIVNKPIQEKLPLIKTISKNTITPDYPNLTKIIRKTEDLTSSKKEDISYEKPSYLRNVPLNPKKDTSSLLESTESIKPFESLGKEIKIEPSNKKSTVESVTTEFFNDIVDRLENTKFKQASAKEDEKKLMNIVENFKRKNPGLSEDDFKNATSRAKSRAESFVQDMIEANYKGTEDFTTKEPYKKAQEKIKTEFPDPNLELAEKYNLKLKEPNEKGIQYLDSDKKGNPIFSDEYLFKHPENKNKTPLDVYGKFLADDWKVSRDVLMKNSQEWSKNIKEWETTKSPYGKTLAKTIDVIFTKKFGENWASSWKFNSALKNIKKDEFSTKNPEGVNISEPFRAIAARIKGKTPEEIEKNVSKANKITKMISEKARLERTESMGAGSKLPEGYDTGRDITQEKDVMKDLTPFDVMMTGINAREARQKLIEDYNNLRIEMKNPRPTIIRGGKKILGTKDEMKLVFDNIKTLSPEIKEIKDWRLGEALKYKDPGLTVEQGLKDGFNIAMKIAKKKYIKGSFIRYEDIKKMILGDTK